ncbi:Isochorismatase-like hydrolase [Venustampulla echinocandica]|uniref:Isochorismatase-like hydrolase n=1 Tax=Venustampulla echinocandica TaxID=2656787 RepID=A0A370TKJ3_9HELO|nr:Isochorismatase-like hydrolase [Venustampulla echinocandica]RDL36043.1 Isochorismatase-like hydrolase [Venustampulla echinocandica]
MSSTPLSQTALVIIDLQQGFNHPTHWGTTRSNPSFESNITALLSAFRSSQPNNPNIFHVRHHSLHPDSPLNPSKPGVAFMDYATPLPGEPVYSKTVNSSLIGTTLAADLRARHIKTLYVCGLVVNHCVGTTVRMAANLHVVDFDGEEDGKIVLVSDATAAWNRGVYSAETVHGVHVESLKSEFCEVELTDAVVATLKEMADK